MKLFGFRRNTASQSSENSSAPISPADLAQKADETLLEELEDILDKTPETEIDEATINAYLSALDEKQPLEREFNATRSWETLKESHPLMFQTTADESNDTRQKKRGNTIRLWPRMAAAAVAAVMVSMVCVQAAGFDVFRAFARWSEETFFFVFSGTVAEDSVSTSKRDELRAEEKMEFSNMQEALDYFDIPLSAPTWMPDGYEEDTTTANLLCGSINLMGSYLSEDHAIAISYFEIREDVAIESEYEKDSRNCVEYEHNSTTYYIMHNLNSLNIAWVSNGFECSIDGPITEEDAQKIIDSID